MLLQNLPQVYAAAKQAGFTGPALVTAIAIAAAESGFDPGATGDQTLANSKWGNSIGLWQIRSLQPGSLYLEPIRDPKYLYDPLYNAKAAYQISKGGTDFTPWSTFVNKAYQQYLNLASEVPAATFPIAGLLLLVAAFFLLSRKQLSNG